MQESGLVEIISLICTLTILGSPGGSGEQAVKNLPAMQETWVQSLDSYLENSMHRGTWQATVRGVTKQLMLSLSYFSSLGPVSCFSPFLIPLRAHGQGAAMAAGLMAGLMYCLPARQATFFAHRLKPSHSPVTKHCQIPHLALKKKMPLF